MKHYNRNNRNRFEKDFKEFATNNESFLKECLTYAEKEGRALAFDKTGTLCMEDTVQEAFLATLEGYDRIMKKDMSNLPESEVGARRWAYIKKTMKLQLKKRVSILADGVKAVRNNGVLPEGAEGIDLCYVPEYYDDDKTCTYGVSDDPYDVEKLSIALETAMGEFLDYRETLVITRYFGIDMDKMTQKQIAKDMDISERTVRNIKTTAIEKLCNQECKKIIQNVFYGYVVAAFK